jgi:hypothetical protein
MISWAIRILSVLAILGSLGTIFYNWRDMHHENKYLSHRLEMSRKINEGVMAAASKRSDITEKETRFINEIENTPEESNDNTAPVLYDAIMRLHNRPES